jgi:hypothetical protein
VRSGLSALVKAARRYALGIYLAGIDIGMSMPYAMFTVGDNSGGGFREGCIYRELVLANEGRLHFTQRSPSEHSGYCGPGSSKHAAPVEQETGRAMHEHRLGLSLEIQ